MSEQEKFTDKVLSDVTRDIHIATTEIFDIFNKYIAKYDNKFDKILFRHRLVNVLWWTVNQHVIGAITQQVGELKNIELKKEQVSADD